MSKAVALSLAAAVAFIGAAAFLTDRKEPIVVELRSDSAIPTSRPGEDSKLAYGLAIEECWRRQESKSITPAEQRFIAGACELMERRYEEKFGRKP